MNGQGNLGYSRQRRDPDRHAAGRREPDAVPCHKPPSPRTPADADPQPAPDGHADSVIRSRPHRPRRRSQSHKKKAQARRAQAQAGQARARQAGHAARRATSRPSTSHAPSRPRTTPRTSTSSRRTTVHPRATTSLMLSAAGHQDKASDPIPRIPRPPDLARGLAGDRHRKTRRRRDGRLPRGPPVFALSAGDLRRLEAFTRALHLLEPRPRDRQRILRPVLPVEQLERQHDLEPARRPGPGAALSAGRRRRRDTRGRRRSASRGADPPG